MSSDGCWYCATFEQGEKGFWCQVQQERVACIISPNQWDIEVQNVAASGFEHE